MSVSAPHFILCFDFDGTLIHERAKPGIHPRLLDMIEELRRKGAAWVVNTGRTLSQTLEGLAQHGVRSIPDFIIAQECYIHRAEADGLWSEHESWNLAARTAHVDLMAGQRPLLDDIRRMLATQTRAKLIEGGPGDLGIIASSRDEMSEICDAIEQRRLQCPDLAYHRNSVYLRFSHAHYSKGSALREVQRLLRLSPARCLAAGDNYNDLSMLNAQCAAMLAAPSNALPQVKQQVLSHGGYVASAEASLGMIEALRHFFYKPPAAA